MRPAEAAFSLNLWTKRLGKRAMQRLGTLWAVLLTTANAMAQSGQPFLVLDARGHTGMVTQVAFTPDAKYVVTVSLDKTIRLWDTLTGESTRTIRLPIDKSYDGQLHDASLSPDGRRLAVAHTGFSNFGRFPAYIVSIPEGEIKGAFLGHREPVRTVRFSADGSQLASGSLDKTIRIWDADTGKTLHTLAGHAGAVTGVSFAPRGDALASCSDDKTVRFWSLADGAPFRTAKLDGAPTGVLWSPTGNIVMAGTTNGSVYIFNARGELLKRHTDFVHQVKIEQFSNDGGSILVTTGNPLGKPGGINMSAIVRATGDYFSTFEVVQRFAHLDFARAARVLEEKQWVASSGGPNHETYLWTANNPFVYSTLAGHGRSIYATGWSRDGTRFAWGAKRGGADTLAASFALGDLEVSGPTDAVFDSTRSDGITFPTPHRARIQHPNGKVVHVDSMSEGRLLCGVWLSGDRVALGTDSGVGICDAHTGKLLMPLVGATREVFSMSVSPNGKYLLVGSLDQFLSIYEIAGANMKKESRLGFFGEFKGDRCPVTQVLPGSPAAKAGIKPGDTILAFTDAAGDYVPCSGENFYKLRGQPGTRVTFRVEDKGGAVREVEVARELLAVPSDEPLVSLFVAGHEWIAWTPEGYYATSPGGETLMGWQVNRGYDKTPEFHPAAQFRKTLYRPDVLKLLLNAGSLEKAIEMADGAKGTVTKRVEIVDVLPPRVAITNPRSSGLKVQDGNLTIEATAASTGEHPVTALELMLDGRALRGKAGLKRFDAPKLGDVRESWNLSLSPGAHRVAVRADSKVSSAISETIDIIVESPKDEVVLPDLHVLAIGISDYPGELRLHYAAKDARVLAETLRQHSKELFRKVEVTSLTDQDASRTRILAAIDELSQRMTQRDIALVFFAGHGERDSRGALYLLPADVQKERLLATAVPASQIRDAFAALPGRILFLIDACHAGAVDTRARSLTDDLVRDLVAPEAGVIVMCASTGREVALESNEHRHGIFTLALVEGLAGKASKEKLRRIDDAVYFHHLDAYVTDRVRELSQGRQHPVTARPASIRSFPLTRPKP